MKGEFYKMDFEAWDEGTDALTLEQEAAYLRACHQLYRRGGAISDDTRHLARLWRCHPNKAQSLLTALVKAGKLAHRNGKLTNTRVTHELHNRDNRRTQQAHAGQTGGTRTQENRRNALKDKEREQAVAGQSDKQNQADKRRGEEKAPDGASAGAHAREGPATPAPQSDEAWIRSLVSPEQPVAAEPDVSPILAVMREPSITRADVEAGIAVAQAKATKRLKTWSQFPGWIRGAAKDRLAARGEAPPAAPRPPPTPEQDRKHRLRLAIEHFRGEWRQGTPEEFRPGSPDCTTDVAILEEAQAVATAERGEAGRVAA